MFIDGTVVFSRRPKARKKRLASFVGKLHSKRCGWTFEVAVRRFDGKIIWISGPYPSRRTDLAIFRSGGLQWRLEKGERICGDRGYVSKDLERIILAPKKKPRNAELTAHAISSNININFQRELIEHVFGRMKKFKAVGSIWRGQDLVYLRKVFWVCCALTNIDIMCSPVHEKQNV